MKQPREACDELALVQSAARGDHDAFGALVRAYEPQLHAYLLQMLGEPESARDAAQDTFLAAYRALPRWRPPEGDHANTARPLSPWLYRIATNKALSLIRARADRTAMTSTSTSPASEPATSGFEERYAARDLLGGALRRLAEEDAACLVLHYIAGERYGEIALKLGLTSEAVRKRVSRGLAALRAIYSELDSEARR
ncbi:MAG TPA: RNA polymerase sigma factor [Ktedonobacterales bacterium]|nr:RNA polymerase sigma factor [Ktedonobacterales bacterium]